MIVSGNSVGLYGLQTGSQDRRVQEIQRVQQRGDRVEEAGRVGAPDERDAQPGARVSASRLQRVNQPGSVEDANYERLFSDDQLDPRSRKALGSYYAVETNTVQPRDGGELVGLDVVV